MNVFKLGPDHFRLVHMKSIEGNRAQIIAAMLLLGVVEEEIHIGLKELDNGHNRANYGIGLEGHGPTFIYSELVVS